MKKDTDSINYPYIYKNENDILTWHEYFNELKLTGTFAGQYEIINTSLLYNCNIIIYRNNNYTDQEQNYSFQFETIINKYTNYINPFASIILIGWVNNNHYVLLFPKKISQKVIKNNSIITNNLSSSQKGVKQINKINNQKKKSKSIESKDEQPMIETGSSEIIKDLKVNQDINIKFKEFLTNYVRNEFSIYPDIKVTKCGETKLQDIYNFLHSEILTTNNKKWPKYIEEAIAHNKNYNFRIIA